MENILAKLDEAVFTDELKKEISESFTASVDAKVETLVAEKLVELVEAKEKELSDKFVAESAEYKEKLLENLDEFLSLIAEEYIKENRITIEESVQGEKLESLLEGFNALLIAGGVELKQISENLDDTEAKEAIAESTTRIDALVVENMELKKAKAELLKMGLVAEVKDGMSVVQKEKFDKLASVVEFDPSNSAKFLKSLEVLKESVVSSKVETVVEGTTHTQVAVVETVEVVDNTIADSARFF
jgi:glutamate racemase